MTVAYGSGGALPVDFEITNVGTRAKVSAAGLGSFQDQTTALLGSGATYTGFAGSVTINAAGALSFGTYIVLVGCKLGAMVFADQAGTLKFNGSYNGSTYDLVASVAIVANVAQCVQQAMLGSAGAKISYTNGGVAQGAFRLSAVLGAVA